MATQVKIVIQNKSKFNQKSYRVDQTYSDDSEYEDFNQADHVVFEEDIEQKQKKRTYALFDEREKLLFPFEIINRAEEISNKMTRTINNRNGRRLKRQFACLYFAHKDLCIPNFSPQGIADAIGLPHSSISSAITDFSPLRSGYQSKKIHTPYGRHPSACLAGDFAKRMGFSDCAVEHVKDIIADAIAADPNIKRRQAETIAVGAVASCAKIYGTEIDLSQLSDISKISQTTIKSSTEQILKAYNSEWVTSQ